MSRWATWFGWRWLAAGLLIAALAWCAGFVWFVQTAAQRAPLPPIADGVVALTGGAERVEVALRLLVDGRARILLISGTGSGVDLPVLARRAGLDPAPFADRVTLGHAATTTRGNAQETAGWVQRNDVKTLIVVTAYYHMPRALTELRRTLTGVRLYPYPVLTPDSGGAARLVGLRLLAEEYSKYLLAAFGLSVLEPERDAARPVGHPA